MKFIELFAGIGGFRYGFEKVNDLLETEKHEYEAKDSTSKRKRGVESKSANGLGYFRCVFSNDFDKYASQIYKKHYGECDTRNIRTVKASEIPDHDLLCAGYPCQAFSIAGKRLGFKDTRGTLFFEVCRILKVKRPRLLLLENVKGLLSHDSGKTFYTTIRSLDGLGYDLQWQVLNSKNFGVPQNRERVFIIGHLRGQSRPKVFPIRADVQENNQGKQGENTQCLTSNYYKSPNAGNYLKYVGAIMSEKNEKWLEDGKELSRNFPQGQRVYSTEGIGSTIAGNAGGLGGKTGLYQTGMKIRRLTPTECERLQGFPDGWTEGISDTQRYKCLGNAVTTNVVTEIGKHLAFR